MVNSFIDKFRSGLKAVQSRQLLILLTKEKQRGNITTVEEFKQRLNELTNKLSTSTLTPTLELFLAEIGDRIDSESFNFMLSRIEDDLKAAFQEANDIDEVISAHETIINDVVIKNLELAINDLESKIDSLEFLNKTSLGLDNAIFNTFRVTQNVRNAFDTGVVFIDPKTGTQSGPTNEASVDLIGEKLVLRNINNSVRIASVRQIYDSQARASELPVEYRSNSVNNIIDDKLGTFWVQSILVSKPQLEVGLFTKLELNLGTVRNINYIHLEPILLTPVDLYNISYIDANNQLISVLTDPIEINSTGKFFFDNISTNKVILTFRNRNYFQTQFEVKPQSPLLTVIRDPFNTGELVNGVRNDLLDIINSPRMLETIGLDQEQTTVTKKYYEYFIGFDNIKVGLSEFEDTSYFLSKTEKILSCGQAVLRVLEKRPTTSGTDIEYTTETQPDNFDTYFHGSIEYYLIKRDFNEKDKLINVSTVPVLPLNISNIRHERLVLSRKSSNTLSTNNIGLLQFYTNEAITDIKVYRNGTLLTPTDLDTINPSETDGWLINTDNTIRNPNQTQAMKIAIQIQRPSPIAIYTVSYSPTVGTTNTPPQDPTTSIAEVVDLTGYLNATLVNGNSILFKTTINNSPIAYSLLNLGIILRQNTANVTLTPVVEEFLLGTSTKDKRKFGDK